MSMMRYVTRLLLNKGMNYGINKGSDYLARRGKVAETPEERAAQNRAAKTNRKMAQRLRRAINLGRRL
ncbi:hypothetical protein ACMA5I_10640 [Paracoccaceae bacterium GXU_MW_L88]